MTNIVFNSDIGTSYDFSFPKLSKLEKDLLLARLFEQLLIFDKVVIRTNNVNFQLAFLLNELGPNLVEQLVERGLLKFLLWTPMIMSGAGRQRDDGTIDESTVIGIPPIVSGSLSTSDLKPSNNIEKALSNLPYNRDRKRILKKILSKHYIVPKGDEFSRDSVNIVIEAYKANILDEFGLPYNKEPEQLDVQERSNLLKLGNQVLESAVLSKYRLKSFENYNQYKICKSNLKNIGDALRVSENTSSILSLENLPNLRTLYLQERINFEDVLRIRNLASSRYYRKWINKVSESDDALEITKEYINAIKGKSGFFESNSGVFVKSLSLLGISSGLAAALGPGVGLGAGIGLRVFDAYILSNLIKGHKPSVFIETIEESAS